MIKNEIAEIMSLKVFYWVQNNNLELSGEQYRELYQIIMDICKLIIEARENREIEIN